jgi:hypothetical protein
MRCQSEDLSFLHRDLPLLFTIEPRRMSIFWARWGGGDRLHMSTLLCLSYS